MEAGANLVRSKWVFHMKKDASRQVVRFKACLLAQGFSQVLGVDYFDMFALVVKLASIWTVLAMAAKLDFELDIKSTYLNGKLTKNENIFMK